MFFVIFWTALVRYTWLSNSSHFFFPTISTFGCFWSQWPTSLAVTSGCPTMRCGRLPSRSDVNMENPGQIWTKNWIPLIFVGIPLWFRQTQIKKSWGDAGKFLKCLHDYSWNIHNDAIHLIPPVWHCWTLGKLLLRLFGAENQLQAVRFSAPKWSSTSPRGE